MKIKNASGFDSKDSEKRKKELHSHSNRATKEHKNYTVNFHVDD